MSLWRGSEPLILASKSAARQALLRAAHIPFKAVPADLDERAVESDAGAVEPGTVALHLAQAKALATELRHSGRFVLGADQTLALGTRRFSKPADAIEARAQLLALSGQTHELHSAIAITHNGAVVFSHVAVARMTMRALSDDFIAAYLTQAGPAVSGSVGGYQVEGLGIHLFARIEGDHATILGLPLLPLLDFLRRQGLLAG